MRQAVVLLFLGTFPYTASVACENLAYGSKKVEGIIEIEKESKGNFFNITIPKEYDGLEFLYAALEKGCSKDGYSSHSIPLQTEERNGVIKAHVKMPLKKAKRWKVHVSYVVGQTEDIIVLDGPAYESWAPLQPYKDDKREKTTIQVSKVHSANKLAPRDAQKMRAPWQGVKCTETINEHRPDW